jgi:hypothetical protein
MSTHRPSSAGPSIPDVVIPLAATLGLGLYISRMIAELSRIPWRTAMLLPLIAFSLVAAAGLMWVLRKTTPSGAQRWPLLLCWSYVLWPRAAVTTGLAIGACCLGAWLLTCLSHPQHHDDIEAHRGASRRIGILVDLLVLLGSLALYVHTLSPGLLPADSGEFQLVAYVLGIAHPPGYPLYTLLGHLATRLPIGDPAYRVNLLSALFGALTLTTIMHTVCDAGRDVGRDAGRNAVFGPICGLLAVIVLGLSPTFWVQSTTANIRSLTALLTALSLAALLRWGRERSARNLAIFAACLGFAAGHHASIALLTPAMGAYLLLHDPQLAMQPRRWLAPLAAFSATLLVLLYLPLRSLSGAPFDPTPIRSVADFWSHVTAAGFRGDMFYFRTWPAVADRLVVWMEILRLQFGAPLAVACLMAAILLTILRRGKGTDPHAALLLVGAWALNTLAAVTYRAPQTVEYLIPSYVAMAMLLGLGLQALGREATLRHELFALLASVLLVASLGHGMSHYESLAHLFRDTSTRDYAEPLLRDAPENALLLSNWHHATALWYLQQVEGLRPDVAVRYVHPEGATPNEEVWLRHIADGLEQGPVLVTNWFAAFGETAYRWESLATDTPRASAWRVRREPDRIGEVSGDILALFGDPSTGEQNPAVASLLEFTLSSGGRPDDPLRPGDILEVRVTWRLERPLERDTSSFVQLLGPHGVVGQGDIIHRADRHVAGEVITDVYRLPLLLHTTPGSYRLITGFYYTTDDGWQRWMAGEQDHVVLTDVTVQAAKRPPPSGKPQDVRFAEGWRLSGVDIDRGIAGTMRLYLHWQRIRTPLESAPGQAAFVSIADGGHTLAEGRLPALAPGETATLALDLPDLSTALALRLHAVDEPEGVPAAVLPRLGHWGLPVGDLRLRPAEPTARYVPLGGEMALLGMEGLPSASLRPGDAPRPVARFLALQPLTNDYSVSLGLERADGSWHLRSDGTPALGAIPTLKWLTGWTVHDPRRLVLPDDAPQGPAIVVLTVYNAFTLQPLPVLDERLVRQGQGTRIEVGRVDIAGNGGDMSPTTSE